MFVRSIIAASLLLALPHVCHAQKASFETTAKSPSKTTTLALRSDFIGSESPKALRTYLAENLLILSSQDNIRLHYFTVKEGEVIGSQKTDAAALRKRPGRTKISGKIDKKAIVKTGDRLARKPISREKLAGDEAVPALNKLRASQSEDDILFPGEQALPSEKMISGLRVKGFATVNMPVAKDEMFPGEQAVKAMRAAGYQTGIVIVTSWDGTSAKDGRNALVGFGSWN